MEIINSDPRVRGDIQIIYPSLARRYIDNELTYIIIVPFYQDYATVQARNNNLETTSPNSKWIFTEKWLEIIEKGFDLKTFTSIDDLYSFIYKNATVALSDSTLDKFIYLNMAFRPFTVTSNDDAISSFIDEIVPVRFLYHALTIGGATAKVLFYNYHNPSETLYNVFNEYKTHTTLFDDVELFLDAGLSSSLFSVPIMRNMITTLYNNIRNYHQDIMYVFDSDVRLIGTQAYTDFINKFNAYSISSKNDYNKILLSGWFRLYNHIMPPSFVYLLILIKQYAAGNRFDTIVNKANLLLWQAETIHKRPARNIRDEIYDNSNLSQGSISTANILYKPTKNKLVFLTDYTLLREPNILRYDYAVRAALYGKRKITAIASRYIGLRNDEITPKVLESLINNELRDEPDLTSYVIVPEQNITNTITIYYNIVVGVAIYTIDLTLTATN